jgi:type I restriction enzyme M protein
MFESAYEPPEGVSVRLEELGDMRGGYAPKQAVQAYGGAGRVKVLQAGDLRAKAIAWEDLAWVEVDAVPTKYVVADGDVLLPLRGESPRAEVIRDPPADVVAAGNWALISPDRQVVDSDYVVWYLNHPATSARLAGIMRGTKLKFLSLTDLRDFDVEVPPLVHQRRIARVHGLNEHVAALESQLSFARRSYIDAITMAALKGVANSETGAS